MSGAEGGRSANGVQVACLQSALHWFVDQHHTLKLT